MHRTRFAAACSVPPLAGGGGGWHHVQRLYLQLNSRQTTKDKIPRGITGTRKNPGTEECVCQVSDVKILQLGI